MGGFAVQHPYLFTGLVVYVTFIALVALIGITKGNDKKGA
jgi:hypothetical protein